jgi:hypothetical protein
VPFIESWKNGTKNTEGRYSTAYRADPDEFMLWSVHDHPDGRNGALARAHGAQERGRGLHVDRDRAGREQLRPLVTADYVIGADERTGMHGASRYGPYELLDE